MLLNNRAAKALFILHFTNYKNSHYIVVKKKNGDKNNEKSSYYEQKINFILYMK